MATSQSAAHTQFMAFSGKRSPSFINGRLACDAEGKILAGRNYRYFEVYISLAIIYWVITFVLERVISYLEKKLRVPEDAPALLDIRDTEVE